MYGPFAESDRKLTQELGVSGGFAIHVEGEAVQEPLIDDRQASPPQLPAARVEPDPDRQAVRANQRGTHREVLTRQAFA
jgi:hypothetical protein